MKLFKALVLLTFICISSLSSAEMNAEQEAEKLLNTMGIEQAFEQSISQMLEVQVQQNAALVPYKDVMQKFFKKHMSYESLKPSMMKMYAEAFTANELQQINLFYATDVGKKTIEKMPVLMAQGAKIGASRVKENMDELRSMVKSESERIKKLQSQ